jgi:hypothetical protein
MPTFFIGIGGVARSGKDSFGRALKQVISNHYPQNTVAIEPLAKPLKEHCRDFIDKYLSLDVFTDKTEEKAVFREMLVWYGKVKREQSLGTYWTSMLDKRVSEIDVDFCIVPDVRYQQYIEDEVSWLKSKSKNYFIHLRRKLPNGQMYPPANMDEKINDNIIRNYADKQIIIDTFGKEDVESGILDLATSAFNDIFVK